MTVTAIVPMRHSSERVPGKNYRPLGGVPLYHHVVRTLLRVPEVGRIVIDTDSDLILDDVAKRFPQVDTVVRPDHLRDGAIAMNDVLASTLSHIAADIVLQTHSTNPFVRADTFSRAIRLYQAQSERYDSVFSVTRLQARIWAAGAVPVNHDPAVLLRTQDLAPLYVENSSFYLFQKTAFLSSGNRIGRNPYMYEIDAIEATDIDEERDFALATAIAESRFLE
jgi:CMP-N-acetylneuraminic acid synthetase